MSFGGKEGCKSVFLIIVDRVQDIANPFVLWYI